MEKVALGEVSCGKIGTMRFVSLCKYIFLYQKLQPLLHTHYLFIHSSITDTLKRQHSSTDSFFRLRTHTHTHTIYKEQGSKLILKFVLKSEPLNRREFSCPLIRRNKPSGTLNMYFPVTLGVNFILIRQFLI